MCTPRIPRRVASSFSGEIILSSLFCLHSPFRALARKRCVCFINNTSNLLQLLGKPLYSDVKQFGCKSAGKPKIICFANLTQTPDDAFCSNCLSRQPGLVKMGLGSASTVLAGLVLLITLSAYFRVASGVYRFDLSHPSHVLQGSSYQGLCTQTNYLIFTYA